MSDTQTIEVMTTPEHVAIELERVSACLRIREEKAKAAWCQTGADAIRTLLQIGEAQETENATLRRQVAGLVGLAVQETPLVDDRTGWTVRLPGMRKWDGSDSPGVPMSCGTYPYLFLDRDKAVAALMLAAGEQAGTT